MPPVGLVHPRDADREDAIITALEAALSECGLLARRGEFETAFRQSTVQGRDALKAAGVREAAQRLAIGAAIELGKSSVVPVAPAPSRSRRELKEEANTHIANGSYAAAVAVYREAIKIATPDDVKVGGGDGLQASLYANVSLALLHSGEAAPAAVAAKRCIDVAPAWFKGYYRRGVALLAMGGRRNAVEAVSALEKCRGLCAAASQKREVDFALERAAAAGGVRFDEFGVGGLCDERDNACPPDGAPPTRREHVEPLTAPQRFAPSDRASIREHLLREGYVVVAGAAAEEERAELVTLLWSYLESATPMRRRDPATWSASGAHGPAHLGLLTWGGIGQSHLMWRARCLPGVGAAFEAAWGLEPGAPMLVSFDGVAAFRPPQLDARWSTRRALEWLHVDQGSTKRGMAGVQGALLLWDQDASSGGFVCVPRSHERHAILVPEHRRKDFVKFTPSDARLDGLGAARLICARAGDLVLWDSRLVHSSEPADTAAALPVDEAGFPRLARGACMISMVPAAAHVRQDAALASRRRRLIERGCTTTHWPQDCIATSEGVAKGSARGADLVTCVERLPPEGVALVGGESCATRRGAAQRVLPTG